ncbi:MAG: type II toxin-antitoxin system VapC family toxin [Actinomycetota bacterium]
MPAEVASVLRRAAIAGDLSDDVGALAHADLLGLRIELVDDDTVGTRIWELRHDLTSYDAWYVAVAELLDVPLATLDHRLVASPGPRCAFRSPERSGDSGAD